MEDALEETAYVLKFGSFFLVHEGEAFRPLGDAEGDELAKRTGTALIEGARSSPLVTRVLDEGIPEQCWAFEIEDEGRTGTAIGILGQVAFEATWPARNWSRISSSPLPERMIIAVNGLTYAVAAAFRGQPPFEDAFEMGLQAQECLKSIYGQTAGCFACQVGPTPMWPTVYMMGTPGDGERQVTPVGDLDVVIKAEAFNARQVEPLLIEMIGEADWAVVEHYGAMDDRKRFIRKDVEISTCLDECFKFHRQLAKERGLAPGRWRARHRIRASLRETLSSLYAAHAEAAEIVNALRRAARESRESFSQLYFLTHCADYTAKYLEDSTDWDDSHMLQAARFLEDDLRASSLEQVTLTAGLVGGIAGAIAGALLSQI